MLTRKETGSLRLYYACNYRLMTDAPGFTKPSAVSLQSSMKNTPVFNYNLKLQHKHTNPQSVKQTRRAIPDTVD